MKNYIGAFAALYLLSVYDTFVHHSEPLPHININFVCMGLHLFFIIATLFLVCYGLAELLKIITTKTIKW